MQCRKSGHPKIVCSQQRQVLPTLEKKQRVPVRFHCRPEPATSSTESSAVVPDCDLAPGVKGSK